MSGVFPASASAQATDADKLIRDADGRLRGYHETNVVSDAGDKAIGAYFAFVALTLVAGLALFKDARRTHLD